MRHFNGLIFMGAAGRHDEDLMHEDPRHVERYKKSFPDAQLSPTALSVLALEARLKEGMSLSSGLQQWRPRVMDEEEHKEDVAEYEKGQQDLEDIVHDVAAALLGRKITIGGKLPYPPEPPNVIGVEETTL